MELSKKKIIILGLGKSGIAAARVCRQRGASVVATDAAPADKLLPEVRALDVELVLGGHQGVDFAAADLVVVSPGVPPLAELDVAERAGVEVIGELELAGRFLKAPMLAIGGTNGKSTTTTLVGLILQAALGRVFVGANLGTPACDAVGAEWDAVVFEVSSFQLERAPQFRPEVSVLLNVTEDHLDRYPSFQAYADAKGNAFVNQTAADVAIVPAGDAVCEAQARRGKGRLVSFGAEADYAVEESSVIERSSGERFSLEGIGLHGRHNLDNAAAALAAVRALSTPSTAVAQGLARFRPLPHRMALAGEQGGVRFYDDSKGTNVGAAVTALLGLSEERGVLIAGGRDKHGSYEPLARALEQKGRALVVLGEAAARIAEAVGRRVPVESAATLEEAVERAFRLARPGDAVLLSPACSSFDMFKSYAERGDRFVAAVAALAERRAREAAR